MHLPIPKGSSVDVQGIICQLPPPGYGKNRLTGEVEYIGIHKRSTKSSEQKWERLKLPADYEARFKKEVAEQEHRQKADPNDDWFDSDLEAIRDKHWKYRFCGHWFMNEGEPTYITGTHWFYLNWCSTNIGYMDFRETDQKLFYVLAADDENEKCGGTIFIGRRQCGKTYMACAWMIDRISMNRRKHGGIQSKADDDAKKVFSKLVNYFVDLPHFFKPVYDTSQGMRPKKELRFFKPSIKGKESEKMLEGAELRSYIDYGPSDPHHYDGDESMYAYILDEWGKPQRENVWDTWGVVRPCMDKEGRWFGKSFVPSTIEDMEVTGEGPKKMWYNSDQGNINANGNTTSGLYRVFFGAHESTFFDYHGKSDVKRGLEFYNNRRKSLAHDPRALSSEIRKNPFTVQEAFRIDGDKCLYNSELLNNQLDILGWKQNLTERGNFVWKDGKRDDKVIWVKDKQGRFEICWLFEKEGESNKVERIGNYFKPLNTAKFVAGADTFSHSVVLDNRRSDGAMVIKKKYDAANESLYNDAFVCVYKYRAQSAEIQYEDMLMAAVYFGCQILFESNKNNWKDYFISRGYEAFLMKLKGYPDYGIPGNQKTHQQLAEVTESYILNSSEKVLFKNVLTDWLEFDINNTTAFDTAMAAGYCLIADNRLLYSQPQTQLKPLSEYGFRKTKIKA